MLPDETASPDPASISALREALQVSPQNLPLRLHLGRLLLHYGRYPEAEQEFRSGLELNPDSVALRIALAECFYQQSRWPEALVIVEALPRNGESAQRIRMLHIRLLLMIGARQDALQEYASALAQYPSLSETDLAEELGDDAPRMFPEAPAASEPRRLRAAQAQLEEELEDFFESNPEEPDADFADVGGLEEIKEEIRMRLIYPREHRRIFRAYGRGVGGGLLLYGPPGCGKTLIARAAAGEAQASFISVGLNEVLDMWQGQSERNLHDLFEQARMNRPCVLFFDEADGIGARRDPRNAGRSLLHQLLSELDGADTDNEGVLVLAATSAPWRLDPAFRRPGRFDRALFAPPPDENARRAILEILLRERPCRSPDLDRTARRTEGFSGADLRALVDRAVQLRLREALRQGEVTPLTTRDLLEAARRIRPSTQEWFHSIRRHASRAEHAALYEDVLRYLRLR